ncbi:hypothetical protein I4U23_008911 [Adineta vaga]|nr:hypothetical protein I4U23_008911 [Adineta vaga]
MHVFLFIIVAASTVFSTSQAASNCSLCNLGEEFIPSNGYNCFSLSNAHVACTCPDQRYTLDKPCRICERENICGDNAGNLCSEVLDTVSSTQNDETHHFSCFCTDYTFFIGKACPSTTTVATSTTTTQPTDPVTTTQFIDTTVTTTTQKMTRPPTTTTKTTTEDDEFVEYN